jgi:hypothetical protein
MLIYKGRRIISLPVAPTCLGQINFRSVLTTITTANLNTRDLQAFLRAFGS